MNSFWNLQSIPKIRKRRKYDNVIYNKNVYPCTKMIGMNKLYRSNKIAGIFLFVTERKLVTTSFLKI